MCLFHLKFQDNFEENIFNAILSSITSVSFQNKFILSSTTNLDGNFPLKNISSLILRRIDENSLEKYIKFPQKFEERLSKKLKVQ